MISVRKFIYALLILISFFGINADIKFDFSRKIFYSTENIPALDYHDLFVQINSMLTEYLCNGIKNSVIEERISSYLKLLNTPVANQLLEDISKDGFVPSVIGFSYSGYLISIEHDFYDRFKKGFKGEKLDVKTIEEYASMHYQIVYLVHMCWRNGVYGKKVLDQIIKHLECSNTNAAAYFLLPLKFRS